MKEVRNNDSSTNSESENVGSEVTNNKGSLESESSDSNIAFNLKAESFEGILQQGELEKVDKFDPSHALMEGKKIELTKAIPQYQEWTPDWIPKDVCGQDDRAEVLNTNVAPWRWICQLLMKFPNGNFIGTGWLIGPRTVMTAGHCLYDSRRGGGWAQSIEVIPGMLRGQAKPYGSQLSTDLRTIDKWVNGESEEYDYGAIILPNNQFGNTLGYFGFTNLSNEQLQDLLVNNSGYPGDKPFGTQWYNGGRITEIKQNKLHYMLDSKGGQSGSPIWRNQNNQRLAIGVHAYGGCPNSATRINREKFNQMLSWRNV
jgi:V8-like Glu-specific endopeptidase